MAEFSTPNRACQRSPRTTELVAPRVAPRVRKTPTKHSPNTKLSPVSAIEGSCLRNETPTSQGTAASGVDVPWLDRKTRTTPVDTDDSSLAISEFDAKALWPSNHPEEEDPHKEDAWEQIQARSQGIKSRMLLSAKIAAEMKAAAAAAAEKKPEPAFGRVVEVITSGGMCNATAEWLSPHNHPRTSMYHQPDNDIVEVSSPTARAESYTPPQSSPAASPRTTDTSSPKSQYVEEEAVPDAQHFTPEAAKSFEEVLTFSSTASSCSSSTGGALNSYSPLPMNSDKSAAETAVTLQTIQEDDNDVLLLQQDKAVKRVLWKRLFRSQPQSTSDCASSDENNISSDILDDIQLHVVVEAVNRASSYPNDGETDSDYVAAEEEENGVETVLFHSSSETPIEDLSTKLTSITGQEEEHPPFLGAVSSESSSEFKGLEEGLALSKTKAFAKKQPDSLLRRVLQGSPSKKNSVRNDDDTSSRKQSTLVSF